MTWRKKTLGLLIGLIAGVALLMALWPPSRNVLANFNFFSQATVQAGDRSSEVRALPVKTIFLGELAPPQRLDSYRGTIEASKSASLSFRRSGRLLEITVREGDYVTLGQVLATLDSSDLQAAVRGIESRIKEANAVLAEQQQGPREQTIKAAQAVLQERLSALELAKLTLAREENLQRSRASSQQAYDEARIGLQRAAAAVSAAEEQLDELREGTRIEQINAQQARIESLDAQRDDLLVQIGDCQLIAPFTGVVARRFVDEGIIAGPERAILKVLQIDPLEARFGVSADDAAKLRPGDSVQLSSGSERFPATIARIEPELDLTTRTQAIIVAVSQSETSNHPPSPNAYRQEGAANADFDRAQAVLTLVPGQTVSLAIEDQRSVNGQFWIPIQALTRSIRGLWSVMAVAERPDGTIIERHDVQVMEVDSGLARISVTTLQQGDVIISEGLHRITPGMLVDPQTTR